MNWFSFFPLVLILAACPSIGPAVQVEQEAFIQPLPVVQELL
jgi:hypothetical protein